MSQEVGRRAKAYHLAVLSSGALAQVSLLYPERLGGVCGAHNDPAIAIETDDIPIHACELLRLPLPSACHHHPAHAAHPLGNLYLGCRCYEGSSSDCMAFTPAHTSCQGRLPVAYPKLLPSRLGRCAVALLHDPGLLGRSWLRGSNEVCLHHACRTLAPIMLVECTAMASFMN